MTDKVQKIREGIERLKSQLIKGACASQIAMETHCKEEAYNEVLAILDAEQEESVSKTPANVESAMQEVEEKSRVFTEAHKGESSDEILAQMRGEEPVNEDLEEEIECSLPKPAWGWNEDYFGKSDPAYSMEQMKEFARHFFELGLKAQKGEKYVK